MARGLSTSEHGIKLNESPCLIGMPAEVLCLEVDLRYVRLCQDRWTTSYEQLCEPVRCNMLLEEEACSARGGRIRCVLLSHAMAP